MPASQPDPWQDQPDVHPYDQLTTGDDMTGEPRPHCGSSQRNRVPCPNPARFFPEGNPFCLRCGVHAKHPNPDVKWIELGEHRKADQ